MWHASLETTHFTFDAFGDTEKDAERAMKLAVKRHCREYGVGWADMWRDYHDGLCLNEISAGWTFRDHQRMGK